MTPGVFLRILQNFKNTYFAEHLGMVASEMLHNYFLENHSLWVILGETVQSSSISFVIMAMSCCTIHRL